MDRQNSVRPIGSIVRNRLLAALPPRDRDLFKPSLELVELKARQVLHHANTPMEYVFLIERGLVSTSTRVAPDRWVEVWLVGSEGMTGLPVLLNAAKNPAFRGVVQVGGSAFRISVKDLEQARELSPALDALLFSYASVVFLQASLSGVCNAHHALKQRLARWLLLASFGLDDNKLPITHNLFSRLLGVRRPAVIGCLGVLESERSIRLADELIEVSDPEKLEATSCHCHQLIKQAYLRLGARSMM